MNEPSRDFDEWRIRLRREGILTRGPQFDLVLHVSLRPAFPPDYDVPGLVAVTFRLFRREDHLTFATAVDVAAALRLGERLGLGPADALAMVDSHERMHVFLQLAGVSEEAEEDASRHVDAVWLSLRHPRAAHLVADREVELVSRVGPDFWEQLIAPEE
ncbi:MAG TPA: hypothetical protein VFH78_08960 [Candidatus Thermoplasmatota archaeon]|nr:hypothetical protein [Candidatus Thermoplasmatota archaeon]